MKVDRARPPSLVARLLSVALMMTATSACESKGKTPPAATAPAPRPLAVFLDDREVATTAVVGSQPRPLRDAAPGAPAVDAWIGITVVDRAGKVHTTLAPGRNQAGTTPVLVAGKAGVDFGFLADGAAAPTGLVVDVARITIGVKGDAGQIANQVGHPPDDRGGGDSGGKREHGDEARPTVSADLRIAISGAGGESVFTGDRLAALPTIKAPSGDTETAGWSLVDVLAAAGITKPKVVHLTDGEGSTLRLDAADFDPTKVILYLKLNRSGVIRFRVFRRVGEAWEVGGELRGITKIHVVEA